MMARAKITQISDGQRHEIQLLGSETL